MNPPIFACFITMFICLFPGLKAMFAEKDQFIN
jgi:hypothetical protein